MITRAYSALYLGDTPSQKTGTSPPSCLLLENCLYMRAKGPNVQCKDHYDLSSAIQLMVFTHVIVRILNHFLNYNLNFKLLDKNFGSY